VAHGNLVRIGIAGTGLLLFPLATGADQVDELLRRLKDKGILSPEEYSALRKAPAAPGPAAPGQPDRVDELMRRLKAKGILSEQDYAALRATPAPAAAPPKVATAEPPPVKPAIPAPAPPPEPTFIRRMSKGIGVHIGDVDVSIAGSVNAFYVHDLTQRPGPDTTVQGGLAAVGENNSAAVRNGLLPGNFTANIATRQRGWDIGVTFGLYPGLNSVTNVNGANSPGNPSALGTTGIDFRQQFLTLARPDVGTLKAGRDIGLFAGEAILNDFSLISVGSPGANVAPSNTALGRIGLGYIYPDFIPQINYTTPDLYGLKATLGVFQPLNAVNFSTASGVLTAHDQPGFQGKLNYKTLFGPVRTQLWWDAITQQLQSDSNDEALPAGKGVQAYGFDIGGKFGWGPAELTTYGYWGRGLGSTGLFYDAVSPAGKLRDSYGYYVQGTWKFFERFTLGISQGASYLALASGENNPLLVDINESQLVGLRYELTDWVKIVGEYIHTHSEAHGGNEADENTFAVGTVVFF
jgi:predicted porin